MKIKEVTLSKTLTVNLGNFNNVKPSISLTWEFKEDEEPNFEGMRDLINKELMWMVDNEPGWMIKETELKDYHKYTVKVPKKGGENG